MPSDVSVYNMTIQAEVLTVAIPEFLEDGWLPAGHHAATWEEIIASFGGASGSRRARLTASLLELRDALLEFHITGSLLLDGSYVSAKAEPGDFDVLLIGPADIQVRKDTEPGLARLLDAEVAEKERGYSLFFIPQDSPAREMLQTFWDISKEGVLKGVVEVTL
jgi:hypothetical protein